MSNEITAAELPMLVREFATRSAPTEARPLQVRISQSGEMSLKPGGKAMRFHAVQDIAIDRIAFAWHARFPLAGPVALSVVDAYDGAAGALTVRLLGLRLQRQGGVETTAGEALRYLAELPFAPIAILHNRELEWRELDDGAVEVAAVIHGERLAVEFEFDGAGNVVRASSRTRKLKRDGVWQTIPWGGEFRNYKPLDGLWIPTSGEVYWDIPEGRYTYWRGEIVHAEMLDQAFRSR